MPALRAAAANLLTVGQSNAQVIGGGLNFFQGSAAATSDIPYLHWTPTYSGDRSTWTISFWAKPSTDSTSYLPFFMATDDNFQWEYEGLFWFANNLYYIDFINNPSYNVLWRTTAVYRDTAWYHIMAVKVDNSTFKLYVNGEEVTDLSSSTNNGAQSTWWNVAGQKMYLGGYINTSTGDGHSCESIMSQFYFISGKAVSPSEFGFTDPLTNTWRPKSFSAFNNPNNGITWSNSPTVTGGSLSDTTDGFDGSITSSGDHCTLTADSSSSAANATFTASIPKVTKVEVFVHSASSSGDTRGTCLDTDGVTHTSDSLKSASQSFHTIYEGDPITLVNVGWGINQNGATGTGSDAFRAFRVNGYILIDNAFEGSRDNSFYLPFDGSAAIGKDQSGNNKEDIEFTLVNFGGTDDVIPESPSGCSFTSNLSSGISGISTSQAPTGYCTWNPLDSKLPSISEGNLDTGTAETSWWAFCRSTLAMTSGKFYWETTSPSPPNASNGYQTGYAVSSLVLDVNINAGSTGYWGRQGDTKYANGTNTTPWSMTSLDDILAFAYDADNEVLYHSINGVWEDSADPANGTNPNWTSVTKGGFAMGGSYGSSLNVIANFGQKPFKYTPPEGYQSINLANLPSPEFVRPDSFVGVTTYAGDGTSVIVRDYQFKPDFVWIKGYTDPDKHGLYDTVRGATKRLVTSLSAAQETQNGVMSFDPNGFSVGNYAETNGSGRGYVAWSLKAGGNKGTFNVDDVGYASASDVNMSVGALNSALYNESAVWSDNLVSSNGTYSSGQFPPQAFNGVSDGSTDMCQQNGAGGNLTWTFTGLSGSVRVWIGNDGAAITDGNGTARGSNVGNGETWLSLSGDISDYNGSIIITPSSDSPSLGAVEVAGKVLVDDDQTPPDLPTVAATGASVGTKQGFSITVQTAVSGSGDTMRIAHGLTQKPDFIIGKDIDTGSTNWAVYHSALGAKNKVELDSNAASAANANYWNEEEPTSSLIYTNAASWMYTSSSFVLYSWHNVPGLQKFGSYTGNTNADGPFIELGFSPAIVIIRKYNTGTNDWYLFDDKLNKYNLSNQYLCPNLDNAKTPYSNVEIDMLSNGFKIRNAEGSINTGNMLYAAWAHQPMNNLYGGQSNAR